MTITQSLKEHVILGTDARDIQAQKDHWLAENPSIKIIETGDIKREPPSLLIRFGGKRVPRFSLFLRYREEASRRDATGISIPAAAQGKGKTNR